MKITPSIKIVIFMMIVAMAMACNMRKKSDHKNEHNTIPETSTGVQTLSDPAQSLRDAALNGLADKAKNALEQIDNVDAEDEEGHTALMLASYNGHTAVAELLLQEGADVNRTDGRGLSPLHFAASGPFAETVKLLLINGADINRPDGIEQFTPLMYAAAEGNPEVVKLLLKHNADITLKDKDGDSAAEFARQNNHPQIAKLIENPASN